MVFFGHSVGLSINIVRRTIRVYKKGGLDALRPKKEGRRRETHSGTVQMGTKRKTSMRGSFSCFDLQEFSPGSCKMHISVV